MSAELSPLFINSRQQFDEMLHSFGIVTVMNARIYHLTQSYSTKAMSASDFVCDAEHPESFVTYEEVVGVEGQTYRITGSPLCLNTLKISNINIEQPSTIIKGGVQAIPIIKKGKKGSCEIKEALGNVQALQKFFNMSYDEVYGILTMNGQSNSGFAIEGETFLLNQKGEKIKTYIFIPHFIPKGVFNFTQDATGEAAVFDLSGDIYLTKITENGNTKSMFYDIRGYSFITNNRLDYGRLDYIVLQ